MGSREQGRAKMNEEKARKILAEWVQPDGTLFCLGHYTAWPAAGGKEHAVLDAEFTADELEAIAWWMRNK